MVCKESCWNQGSCWEARLKKPVAPPHLRTSARALSDRTFSGPQFTPVLETYTCVLYGEI